MNITGQRVINAPREKVWTALNTPAVLKASLPGCELVEQTSPEEFKVVIKVVIGPMRARFSGVLRLSDVLAPSSCTMHFDGQGGTVGFGSGQARVRLSDLPEGTQLDYEAKAMLGGSLAQVGSRLLDGVIKKMSDDFFKAFQEQVVPGKQSNTQIKEAVAAARTAVVSTDTAAAVVKETSVVMIPAWWLAPAVLLGGLLTIMGSMFMR